MRFDFQINGKKLKAMLAAAMDVHLGKSLMQLELQNIASGIMSIAANLAPVALGKLHQSYFIEDYADPRIHGAGIRFGFNRIYARLQDWPKALGPGPVIVRPKRKRWIYVPLTKRARTKPYGAIPPPDWIFGGFVMRLGRSRPRRNFLSKAASQGWQADYVLAKEVHIPVKSWGSSRGPNRYFSETFNHCKKAITDALRNMARNILLWAAAKGKCPVSLTKGGVPKIPTPKKSPKFTPPSGVPKGKGGGSRQLPSAGTSLRKLSKRPRVRYPIRPGRLPKTRGTTRTRPSTRRRRWRP